MHLISIINTISHPTHRNLTQNHTKPHETPNPNTHTTSHTTPQSTGASPAQQPSTTHAAIHGPHPHRGPRRHARPVPADIYSTSLQYSTVQYHPPSSCSLHVFLLTIPQFNPHVRRHPSCPGDPSELSWRPFVSRMSCASTTFCELFHAFVVRYLVYLRVCFSYRLSRSCPPCPYGTLSALCVNTLNNPSLAHSLLPSKHTPHHTRTTSPNIHRY